MRGEYIKLKADYETLNPKQTMHIVILDPSEKEIFSIDQYHNSQKGIYSTMLSLIQNNGGLQVGTR